MPFTLRPARASDAAFLWEMLTHAASMPAHDAAAVATAQADAYLSRYVAGWGRAGDLGVIAEEDGAPIGAAWLRLGDGAHSMKLGDAEVPELAIAVTAAARGSGAGTAMLAHLIEAARSRYPAIVLSVRETNPAVRLYERLGFRTLRTIPNRVGTVSLEMRLELG